MWAHSSNFQGKLHRFSDHARSTAMLSGRFSREFCAEELGFALGLFHDAGKTSSCWQERLLSVDGTDERVGIPHKEAGAALLVDRVGVLSMALLGHHGGLTSKSELRGALGVVAAGDVGDQQALWDAFVRVVPEAAQVLQAQQELVPSSWKTDALTCEMGVRMAFSALVDADHLDTSAHFDGLDAPRVRPDTDMAELVVRFEQQRQRMLKGRASSPVDGIREEVYHEVLEYAAHPTGIFRMPAPTGVGKTISAAGFGLRHAAVHGKRRVIVAVPFMTVTEQNAGVYRDLLGSENVLEHHSTVTPPEDAAAALRWRSAAENWDSPLVVTTTVQLFDSLFARKPSRMRKLHRLANAVIVLDEVQALPLPVLIPILNGLRVLSERFNTTVLLTSATQPAFEHLAEWSGLEMTGVVRDPAALYRRLRRVRYEWWLDPKPSLAEVADRAAENDQVLVVVNTVADARRVYQRWVESNLHGIWHLSTRMCPAHRRVVLEEVDKRLSSGQPVRLVSTQLIEAGVDVDFPTVYRAMAPAESLQQAAGRANREGKRAEGKVVIFDAGDMGAPSGYGTGTDVTRQHFGPRPGEIVDPDNLSRLSDYFRTLYRRADTENGERNTTIQRNRAEFDFVAVTDGPFKRAVYAGVQRRDPKLAFRMLDEDTIPVVVPSYDEDAAELLESLRLNPDQRGRLVRELHPYVVALPKHVLADDALASLVVEIAGDFHEWRGDYHPDYGIDTSTLIREEVW